MPAEPKIPFGYKQVQGQSQKGDGIWDAVAGKFRKVKKQYPFCGGSFPVIIRKCEAVQQELPVASGCRIFEFE